MIYLTNTRLDIFFTMNKLTHVHQMVVKHAVMYLRGTVDYGLKYEANQNINLEGCADSDWAAVHFRVLLQYGIMCDLLV